MILDSLVFVTNRIDHSLREKKQIYKFKSKIGEIVK